MGLLSNRVALVTGAATGMGEATARCLAEEGARVVVADVDVEGGEATVARVREMGGEAVFVRADVAEEDDVVAMVETCLSAFGALDCAVNNAALRPDHRPLIEADLDEFDRIIAVNLRGVLACMKHEARCMRERGGGAIVNIGSTSSFRPQAGSAGYVAAKHGVIGLTRTASAELAGQGVRVNAVCPGATRTPMLEQAMARRGVTEDEHAARFSQLRRFADPREVAEASLWLCSDRSSFVTGHALAVDGGYLAW
jgi:NAD(P)-dependent dehydrogenase (short-subunit alcohol dehydrogenase family)